MYYFNKKNPYIILKRENENNIITNIYNTGCVEIVNKKINKEEAMAFGIDTFTLSRGMVNTMGDIRGVDSWVNFTETDEGVLCEIRSAKYNINPIAVKHGGGGHAKASGATLKSREEAMELVAELEALAN